MFLNSCGSAWMHHYGQYWQKSYKHRRAQGDPDGFCSQSESKEGGGKRKQRKKGTFFQWMLDAACSNRDSFCRSGCEVPRRSTLQLCSLDTIWIFQLPVHLFFLWTKCYVLLNLFLLFFLRTNNSSSNCVAWRESWRIMHSCICALTSHLRNVFTFI